MLSELEAGLGYTFRDKSILENALTHSSYANENRERGLRDNERLEFLGDSILGFVVADYLYRSFPDRPEGELTRIRADLVCEKNLARAAGTISLGSFLLCYFLSDLFIDFLLSLQTCFSGSLLLGGFLGLECF